MVITSGRLYCDSPRKNWDEKHEFKSLAQCLAHSNCLKGVAYIKTVNLVIQIKSVADKANFLFLTHASKF